jgi:uncharacterized protein
MSAPGAVPYHRLSRTPGHLWWRPVLGTFFVFFTWFAGMMVLSVVVWGAGLAAGGPEDQDGLPSFGDAGDTALSLAMLGMGIPVVLFAAWAIQRRRPGTLASVTGRLRWRWLGTCLLVSLGALFGSLVLMTVLVALTEGSGSQENGNVVSLGEFALAMALILPMLPLQTSAEEFICRGWLLQAVGSLYRGIWPALLLQAVVFTALHGFGTVWGVIDLMMFGLFTGWLTIRTGGLEAALALHFVNNLVGFVMSAAFGELGSQETAADSTWQMAAVDAIVLTLFAVAVLRLATRRKLERTGEPAPVRRSPAPQAPWSPAGTAVPPPQAIGRVPAPVPTTDAPVSSRSAAGPDSGPTETVPVTLRSTTGSWVVPGSDPWTAKETACTTREADGPSAKSDRQ